jgi:thiol-disulfide isomerase/thioredoxin
MKRFILLSAFGLAILTFASSCEQDNRISGCADPFAINFDPNVLVSDDDGTCAYPVFQSKGILFDITATWCGPCGDWGAPLFDTASAQNKGNVISIGVHPSDSDPFYNTVAEGFATNYPDFTGYPTIVYNNEMDFGPGGEPAIMSAITAFNSVDPLASSIAIAEVSNGQMEITAQTRWFDNMTGVVHMVVYILEDGQKYPQAPLNNPEYVHNHVLRGSMNNEPFGEAVLNGDSWDGKSETRTYTVNLEDSWVENNISIFSVLWKSTPDGWEFINATEGEIF